MSLSILDKLDRKFEIWSGEPHKNEKRYIENILYHLSSIPNFNYETNLIFRYNERPVGEIDILIKDKDSEVEYGKPTKAAIIDLTKIKWRKYFVDEKLTRQAVCISNSNLGHIENVSLFELNGGMYNKIEVSEFGSDGELKIGVGSLRGFEKVYLDHFLNRMRLLETNMEEILKYRMKYFNGHET